MLQVAACKKESPVWKHEAFFFFTPKSPKGDLIKRKRLLFFYAGDEERHFIAEHFDKALLDLDGAFFTFGKLKAHFTLTEGGDDWCVAFEYLKTAADGGDVDRGDFALEEFFIRREDDEVH